MMINVRENMKVSRQKRSMADFEFFFQESYSALCNVLIGFLVIFLIIHFQMAAKMCEVVKRETSMKNRIDGFGWTELHAAKVPLGMLKTTVQWHRL